MKSDVDLKVATLQQDIELSNQREMDHQKSYSYLQSTSSSEIQTLKLNVETLVKTIESNKKLTIT